MRPVITVDAATRMTAPTPAAMAAGAATAAPDGPITMQDGY
jgi:hypothetical protein